MHRPKRLKILVTDLVAGMHISEQFVTFYMKLAGAKVGLNITTHPIPPRPHKAAFFIVAGPFSSLAKC